MRGAQFSEMHMPNRITKFASAILFSFLAGIALTVPYSAARAADDCLSGPKEETPEGGHWYYRIDHATKRHCWYLRDESGNVKVTAPTSRPSGKPVAAKADAAMQPAIADARAELPAPTRGEVPNRIVDVPAPLTSANATIWPNDAVVPGAETRQSVIASRWPDPSSAAASPSPAPTGRDTGMTTIAASRTEPSTPATDQAAAANDSPRASTQFSPMQLAAMLIAALALTGIIASLFFRTGSIRRPAPGKVRRRQEATWESTDDDSIVLSDYTDADVLPRRRGFARNLDRADGRNDRIAEFFSQLSKRRPV
jgi:hypothetical protein